MSFPSACYLLILYNMNRLQRTAWKQIILPNTRAIGFYSMHLSSPARGLEVDFNTVLETERTNLAQKLFEAF